MDEAEFCRLWHLFQEVIDGNKEYLNSLDAAIGDADHGTNMARGMAKAVAACDQPEGGLRVTAKAIAMAMLSTVGGASGALWGSGLLKFAAALPEAVSCSDREFAGAVDAFVSSIRDRGKANLGDKTMVDVFLPARDRLIAGVEAGEALPAIAEVLAEATAAWALETKDLIALKGRAAYLGERSRGHVDPGAFSSSLWFLSLSRALAERSG